MIKEYPISKNYNMVNICNGKKIVNIFEIFFITRI